jgi:hypothetical protein
VFPFAAEDDPPDAFILVEIRDRIEELPDHFSGQCIATRWSIDEDRSTRGNLVKANHIQSTA